MKDKQDAKEQLMEELNELRQRICELEREPSESDKRFADSLPITVIEFDSSGNLEFINHAGTQVFGYSSDNFVNEQELIDIFVQEDRDRALHNIQTRLRGITSNTEEYTVLTKDGQRKNIVAYTNPIRANGKIIGFRSVIIDITERKQMEEVLGESEKSLRILIKNIPDVILSIDREGRILSINRAVAGLTIEEAIGKNQLDYIEHKYHDLVRNTVKNVFLTGKPASYEVEGVGPYGKNSYYETRILPNSHKERVISLTLITRDVSQLKEAENERRQLQERIHKAKKMETVGILAGGIAHDLNNVLAGLVSYPDLLLMELPENSPLKEPITTIRDSGIRAAAIVQDLLALARRGVVITEAINLNDVVREYLSSLKHKQLLNANQHVTFQTSLENNLINILASPSHLFKVLVNLTSNAFESIDECGRINITTRNQYVDTPLICYERIDEGEYSVLSVTDNGCGISPKDIEKIFEPFYTNKTMKKHGTGLGLSVVWGIVKDHKGYIDVSSSQNKGTTFELYFPTTRMEVGVKEESDITEPHTGKGESVLVIDDINEQRDIACAILSRLGYTPTAVNSGEEALEYLKDNSCDLLLLDMIMDPGIDGLETYRRILDLHPKQKAVITSGFSKTDRVKEAQRLGAGQFIKKPYTLHNIALAIRNELDK